MKNVLTFLQVLKINNNKEWFKANTDKYEIARGEFLQLVEKLISGIGKFDNQIIGLHAKQCTFRQHRDVRFSKDKSPFKINMGAYFNSGGKKINSPGYYIHIEPGGSFIAGGLYMPDAALLAKIRQEIDYNPDEWLEIMRDKRLLKAFSVVPDKTDSLVRPPKGYETDNPMIDYLKLKSFTVNQPLTDAEILDAVLLKRALKYFQLMHPMLQFLARATM